MKTIRQIIYDLRHQPVIAWVTIVGTALAVCLISVVSMVDSVKEVELAPETHRQSILHGDYLHGKSEFAEFSGGLDYYAARFLYDSIPGVKMMSLASSIQDITATVNDGMPADYILMLTDENYWKIFDFKFLAGRPYDHAAVQSGIKEAVITRDTARSMFGDHSTAVGKQFHVNGIPYTVVGVVENTTSLMSDTYSDIFSPLTVESEDQRPGHMGRFGVLLLPGSATVEEIRETVESRYGALNAAEKELGFNYIYHGQPYDYRQAMVFSNIDPEQDSNMKQWILYAILLIVPAINLSTMTRARLMKRISDIGVRRAYGCTRRRVVFDMLAENFLITLIGGIIGFALSLIVCYMFTELIMANGFFDSRSAESMRLSIWMLINPYTLIFTLLFCFVLNLLSAGIPAWNAAKVSPVEAISSSKQ